MDDVLNVAADWLEHGRPGERSALVEAARFGEPLWSADGIRAYSRQGDGGFRLSVVGTGSPLVYELPGVEGGWFV